MVSARTPDAVALDSTSAEGFSPAIGVLFVVVGLNNVEGVEPTATWEVGFAKTAGSLVASGTFLAGWVGPQATAKISRNGTKKAI